MTNAEKCRAAYAALTPEQKLERSRRNKACRLKKHGAEALRIESKLKARKSYAAATPERRRQLQKNHSEFRARHPNLKLFYGAKYRARESGIPFALKRADIVIPDRCPVLGIVLCKGDGKLHDGSPTLDRFIPDLGYVPGNVAVMSHRANRMKQNATVQEFELLVAWMKAHA